VERPAKRCYVGLVAVGVQEQAEDILVPPLLRNCLTFNYIPFPSHYLPPQNSGPCNSFYCLGHFKNVYDDDDDEDGGKNQLAWIWNDITSVSPYVYCCVKVPVG